MSNFDCLYSDDPHSTQLRSVQDSGRFIYHLEDQHKNCISLQKKGKTKLPSICKYFALVHLKIHQTCSKTPKYPKNSTKAKCLLELITSDRPHKPNPSDT
jgi:hypothetical protein